MEFLRLNQQSLAAQSDPDYQQIIIVDEYQRGVDYANGQMATRDWSDVQGEYVLILDDDDVIANDILIEDLKDFAYGFDIKAPNLFVVKMDHGPWGILPDADTWRRTPQRGKQGCSSVIPSRAIFLEAVKAYTPKYDGDFDFVSACHEKSGNVDVVWVETVATRVQQIGALTKV